MQQDDLRGTELGGRYALVEPQRSGKYGDIWTATTTDSELVSVKLLKPELFLDEQATLRFERETKLLRKFTHPNLLRVIDSGRTDQGLPYLVLEHKEGRLLSTDIGELALSVDKVCHVAMQIAAVLAAAHSRGIVHRGLNPDAILLCHHNGDDDHVKVLDFGMAHLTPETGEAQVTRVGQRLGQPEYMAPEYISSFTLDARTDVYVLGTITFEMLTGQPPFVGRAQSVLLQHMEKAPWRPSEMSEQDVPDWLDELVVAMLAKDPNQRPQRGLAVARAFMYRRYPVT